MSYLGNTPTDQSFVATVDYFNGDGSTVAFTLSRQVASIAQVQAVIENVPQNPSQAFSVLGNVITFTSAPPSGSANIYVYYTSPNTKVMAPSASTVDTVALAAAAVTSVKMANGGYEFGMRNRIINGDMKIDQRNAGASVSGQGFAVDRFCSFNQTDGAITSQQVSDAPEGFNYSYKITVTTADTSLGSVQYMELRQVIEGHNVADLGWGTASAKTVTLSFWVKSSLTGTFGGALVNSNVNRSYPFSYNISIANTWEYKTITVAGDITGTWEKTNGNGMFIMLNLGSGTDFQGTANSWVGSRKQTVSGAVSLIGTLNATWQITGIQLEKGPVATPFEYHPYGTELALCQRYYQVVAVGCYQKAAATNDSLTVNTPLQVQMRSDPTASEKTSFASSNVSTTYPVGSVLLKSTGCILRAIAASAGNVDYQANWQFSSEFI